MFLAIWLLAIIGLLVVASLLTTLYYQHKQRWIPIKKAFPYHYDHTLFWLLRVPYTENVDHPLYRRINRPIYTGEHYTTIGYCQWIDGGFVWYAVGADYKQNASHPEFVRTRVFPTHYRAIPDPENSSESSH
jgi:hypothetical protein